MSIVLRAAILCLVGATIAQAAEVTYTTRAAYNAATTGNTILTFQGLTTTGSATFYNSPPGITSGGIKFESTANQLYAIDPAYTPGAGWNFPQGQFLDDNNYNFTSSLNATLLPANTTAIGADFGLQTGNTATSFQLQLTLSNSDILVINLAASNSSPILSFFGFTSDVPITSIAMKVTSVNNGNGSLVVDNFTFGQAAVPEPGTIALVAVGAMVVGARFIRRKR
jgi:hypothetical protein